MSNFLNFSSLEEFKAFVPDPLPDGFVLSKRQILLSDKLYDVSIYNYVFANFPPHDSEYFNVLREMRGLIFCSDTGEIISRPFHKFFNLGERPETMMENLSWDEPHNIFEKHDGSLIHASWFNGQAVYSTRMGPTTDIAISAAQYAGHRYDKLLQNHSDHTFMFEYCGPKNQIVIPHDKEKFELLAIRNKFDGSYADPFLDDILKNMFVGYGRANEYGFKMDHLLVTDIEDVKSWNDTEGIVISWSNGERVKLKTEEYVSRHKMVFLGNNPKTMLKIILDDGVDDFKSMYPHHCDLQTLIDYEQKYINYASSFKAKIKELFDCLSDIKHDRKMFALEVMSRHKEYAPFMFKMLDNNGDDHMLSKNINEYHRKTMSAVIEDLSDES